MLTQHAWRVADPVAGQVISAVAAGRARIDEDAAVAKAALAALDTTDPS